MAIIGGVMQGSPLAMVLSVDVGSVLEQDYAGFEATALASQVQRRALKVILPFHLRFVDQKCL